MAEYTGDEWLRFVRRYGPIATNDNMYDETIQRAARRHGIDPITFQHPHKRSIFECFASEQSPTNVLLTGTAGDGKTNLCRQVWDALEGDPKAWASNHAYLKHQVSVRGGIPVTLHVLRDLSAWVPPRDAQWDAQKVELLQTFCTSLFSPTTSDLFLLAANDGQLVESWRRLPSTPEVERTRALFERLLVENRRTESGVNLQFFNLSRGRSSELLQRTLEAFLSHPGWDACFSQPCGDEEAFGPSCPIRHNYTLLQTAQVQDRLTALFDLCDYNGLHIPIRQILLLLTNALLGHPDCNDRLMAPKDIPRILREGIRSKASLYNNLFGGNLPPSRYESLAVFAYLDRFRIGHETTNRIDNILIFGDVDTMLRPYHTALLDGDEFYGADTHYRTTRRAYVDGGDEDPDAATPFLDALVRQRRGLFFKISAEWEEELRLWELTVFSYAGEYLTQVVVPLEAGNRVERMLLSRLIKGLNRIFVGMLLNSERELLLATSLSASDAKVSRMLEERISVAPRLGERVEITLQEDGLPALTVFLTPELRCSLPLTLIRYEFLSRVAEGALPSSFSSECHEDLLAFKSQLLSALTERRREYEEEADLLTFTLLSLDDDGHPKEEEIELRYA